MTTETETTQPIAPDLPPLWLVAARGELGVAEWTGDKDNPRVLEYLESVQGKRGKWFLRDAVPWCSAFMNWCVQRAGLVGTGDPAAKSWETWGVACELKVGAICVVKRGLLPWQRHVGIVDGWDEKYVYLTGGNQNNRVTRHSPRPRSKITAVRWAA